MKITRTGKTIHVGGRPIGPGTARALADMIRRKVATGSLPVVVILHDKGLRFTSSIAAVKAAVALERHATDAEVCRGPVEKGPTRAALDEILGKFTDLIKGARR